MESYCSLVQSTIALNSISTARTGRGAYCPQAQLLPWLRTLPQIFEITITPLLENLINSYSYIIQTRLLTQTTIQACDQGRTQSLDEERMPARKTQNLL